MEEKKVNVMELADMLALESSDRNIVWVQVPPFIKKKKEDKRRKGSG